MFSSRKTTRHDGTMRIAIQTGSCGVSKSHPELILARINDDILCSIKKGGKQFPRSRKTKDSASRVFQRRLTFVETDSRFGSIIAGFALPTPLCLAFFTKPLYSI
jgi:hypothetical protein